MPNTPNLHWLKRFVANLSDRRAFILSFVLGFIIRLIPELLSYPNPIGFDTVYYAARIKSGVVWNNWTAIFSNGLFEGILVWMNKIVQIDPFLLLKLTAPVLYALNVCGIYYFSSRTLGWDSKKAFLAALFFAFQLASLRLSWDLYKNVLGLAILLFTLPLIRNVETKRGVITFVLLSVLIVFTHILVSVVLFSIILGIVVSSLIKNERAYPFKLLAMTSLAFAIFALSVYFYSMPVQEESNVISAYLAPSKPGGIFFLINYFAVSDSVHYYPTYLDLFARVLSLFGVLYILCLPLIIVGFFRDKTLDVWTVVLLGATFNSLIIPSFALDFWHRWMFMLVYPFTFYAVNGVDKIWRPRQKNNGSTLNRTRISRRTMLAILLLTVAMGSAFMASPAFFDRYGLFLNPVNSYLPSTMLYNSIPLRDVKSTIQAMEWLNANMGNTSILLVHHAFLWWADLYLNKEHMMIYFVKDVENAVGVALEHGYKRMYLIWWNESYLTWQNLDIGWYGVTLPKYFIPVTNNDRIRVFEYSLNDMGG
jgi:hypothetical protein